MRGPDQTSLGDRVAPAMGMALGAGALGAVQPKINAELGTRLGSALVASLVNFGAALIVVAIVLAVRPSTRHTLAGIRSWPVPRWTLTAGLGGAIVVIAGAVAVKTIGVAIFTVAFFAGQISFGLIVDSTGVGPGGARPVGLARLTAVFIAIAAVVVSQVGRPVGDFNLALVAFVAAAGAASALQSAFNGRIADVVGDAFAATAFNVVVGSVAIVVCVGVLAEAGEVGTVDWPSEPWLYVGGLLGVTIVLSIAIASAAVGVLRATLAMLAAQLTGAFLVDWVVQHDTPTAGVIAGSVLIVVAVAVVGRQPAALAGPVPGA